ncbi:MAG: hypothetical protein K5766_02950 [Alphaproteobacteria bacterium]|nr:hypothetical protein [Alphaproteobacteria bacterium]
MKKILACVLALSFCTTTVEAGLFSGIKNKVKNIVSKSKNSENKEIKTWLKNLKTLISNVILDVQEISASASKTLNNTKDEETRTKVGNLKTKADKLKEVLESCKKDPFKIMDNKETMNLYIDGIWKLNIGNVAILSTETDSSGNPIYNYGKLVEKIKKYEEGYASNLTSMKTAVAEIKAGWPDDEPTKTAAENLESKLNEYEKLTKVINDTEITEINKLISELSSKPGQEHKDIKILTKGVKDLKNHAKYKEQSEKMAQPFLKRVNNKLKNATKKISNAQSKLNDVTKKIESVENTSIDVNSLKNNSIIKSAVMND